MHQGEGVKTVKLRNQSVIVPKSTTLINPQSEGMAEFLYFFWTVPNTQDMSIENAGSIYGWFSDYDFLHIFGTDNSTIAIDRSEQGKIDAYNNALQEVMSAQRFITQEAVFDNPLEGDGEWDTFICCWMICDMFKERPFGYIALKFKANEGR